MQPANLLTPLPEPSETEHFEDLLLRPSCRLERIVSHGQASPPDFWYDQEEEEWVMILEGEATLEFDEVEGRKSVVMKRGDHLLIPARCRHRVAETASPTVWLALRVPPER